MNSILAIRRNNYLKISYKKYISETPRSCELTSSREKVREKRWIRTEEFRKYFENLEENVDYNVLTPIECEIHQLHKIANDTGKFTYKDPESGFKVFSGLYHYLRGKCCGQACRHCPYKHIGVPEKTKEQKRFNSAFFVPIYDSIFIIDPTLIPRNPKREKS